MIPKTLYLYWGGRGLSWLRYLTVVSFAKHNPDWEIKVYYPTSPTKDTSWTTDEQRIPYKGVDWMSKLDKYAELITLNIEIIGGKSIMPEVHKSDLFRLWALYEFGGVYSDFDIIYTKPMPALKKRLFCHHPDGHYAIGLLAAPKGDQLYKQLLTEAQNSESDKYQGFGATLWGKTLEEEPAGWNIPKNLVYSSDWNKADALFTESMTLPKKAIGIHWYGGGAGEWENTITPETYQDYPSTITNLIKELS